MTAPKDNYWFPAKRYGWGWGIPNCWQGWLVFIGYLALMAIAALKFLPQHRSGAFIGVTAVLTVALTAICWLKGEPPEWRWGGKQ
jgi:hypothetical protein